MLLIFEFPSFLLFLKLQLKKTKTKTNEQQQKFEDQTYND